MQLRRGRKHVAHPVQLTVIKLFGSCLKEAILQVSFPGQILDSDLIVLHGNSVISPAPCSHMIHEAKVLIDGTNETKRKILFFVHATFHH